MRSQISLFTVLACLMFVGVAEAKLVVKRPQGCEVTSMDASKVYYTCKGLPKQSMERDQFEAHFGEARPGFKLFEDQTKAKRPLKSKT